MKKVKYFLIVFSLALAVNSFSQPRNLTVPFKRSYALSLKLSTLGVGLDGTTNLAKNLNVRLGGHFIPLTYNGGGSVNDEYRYSAKANLLSFSAIVDYFPGGSIFKVSGGLLLNLNTVDVTMIPNQTYYVNGKKYNSDNLGDVLTTTDFNKVAPYLGIGLCNPLSYKKFGFTMDIGGIYQSNPKITMTATKLMTPTATQSAIVEDNVKWFKFYPVLTLGLTYKFN